MRHFLFLFLLLLSAHTYAQRTLTGQVTDTDGEPLIGVNILVKDTEVGTITDFDGQYSLRVPENGKVLVFSYIGYASEEVLIGTQTRIDLKMSTDAEALDEVVVIGYGTKKKRDVIGSVATVKSEDITKLKTTSFVDGLQGQASGVQVVSNSGVPGAPSTVKIRGISSISIDTDPLWIVDGMPIYTGSSLGASNGATAQDPMSMINPNDIESIQVLKDAAATAIYGSRGSNGVIIITTKSGKKGQGSITVDYSAGLTEPSRTADDIGFANTEEWFNLVETARFNSFGGEEEALFDPNSILNLFQDDPIARLSREEALAVNTNWFDQILDQGNYQDINVSGTKGFEGGNMYVSFGYRNDNSAGWGNANRNALPWYPIFNSDHPTGYWNPMSGNNLVAAIDRDMLVDEVTSYRGMGGLALEYQIPAIRGLSLRAEGSFDLLQSNTLNWVTASLREFGSFASDESRVRQSINYNVYAKYNRDFGNHGISLTAGTESQSINQQLRLMEGQNLTGTYKEIGNPQDLLTLSGGLSYEEYLRAFFGRADYKFLNRYFLGLSFRQDGSSKFNEDYRWGTFPAVSAGWVISDEPFWNNRTFSTVKLRGGLRVVGRQSSRFSGLLSAECFGFIVSFPPGNFCRIAG